MYSLNALLSASAWLAKHTPLIFGIIGAIILVAAFFIGCMKGVRKVTWGGIVWAFAGVCFLVFSWLLQDSIFIRLLEIKFTPQVASLILNLILLALCAIIALIVHGILAARFHAKRTRGDEARFAPNSYEYDKQGNVLFKEYDPSQDEEAEETEAPAKAKKKADPPHVVSRLFGGLICMLNTAMVLATLASVFLLAVYATDMVNWNIGSYLSTNAGQKLTDVALKYAFDFITIGVMIGFAIIGWRKGFLRSLRLFVIVGGALAAIVFGFGLPFSRMADEWHFLSVFVARCESIATPFTTRLDEVGGRMFAGLVLSVLNLGIVFVLAILANKLVKKVEGNVINYSFDGIMGSILMLVLGAMIILTLWAIAYGFDFFGVLHVRDVLSEKATLSNSLYESMEIYMEPLIQKFLELVKGN